MSDPSEFVDDVERRQADDPAFGEGSPETAPWAAVGTGSWRPTRKFVASLITGLVVFALTKLAVPLDPILEQALNAGAMLLAAYLVPNDPTPGGVPE